MVKQLIRWFHNLTTEPSSPGADFSIPESQAVLCDDCHRVSALRGFVIGANPGDTCPRRGCGSTNLKFIPAWMRTPEEQREHWEGRKVKQRTGRVIAINDGIPLPLPKRTVSIAPSGTLPVTPKPAA